MRREEGIAVVELLVAVLILATGAIAVLGIFDASTRNTFRAEQTQVAINRAQRELEQIRQLAYKDVALTTTPAASSDPKDPATGSAAATSRSAGTARPRPTTPRWWSRTSAESPTDR